MEPVTAAFAFYLITTPPEVPEPPLTETEFVQVSKAVRDEAVRLEILDPKETRYIGARFDEWDDDLKILRRRYQNLQGAPLSAEADKFPDRDYSDQMLALNRGFKRTVSRAADLSGDRYELTRQTHREIDALYHVWDLARDSKCQFYYVVIRRQNLKELRDKIGKDAFIEGRLPSPVPAWRTLEVK